MKICIPTTGNKGLDESVYDHFGSAPYFTIVDTDANSVEVLENINQHHGHGQCHPMSSLSGRDIKAVVCNSLGRRAVEMLNDDGIKVYLARGKTVKDVVEQIKSGELREIAPDQACGRHGSCRH